MDFRQLRDDGVGRGLAALASAALASLGCVYMTVGWLGLLVVVVLLAVGIHESLPLMCSPGPDETGEPENDG